MTKHLSIFNNLRPYTVGFDDWFDHFEHMMDDSFFRGNSNFPPYNIVKTGDNTYDIELALAGGECYVARWGLNPRKSR